MDYRHGEKLKKIGEATISHILLFTIQKKSDYGIYGRYSLNIRFNNKECVNIC